MKLVKLRDSLGAVGEEIKDNEFIQIALNGFSSSWHYVICGQGKLLDFEAER